MRQHKMFVFLLRDLEVSGPVKGPTIVACGGGPAEKVLVRRNSGRGPQDEFFWSSREGPLVEVLRNNSKKDVCK